MRKLNSTQVYLGAVVMLYVAVYALLVLVTGDGVLHHIGDWHEYAEEVGAVFKLIFSGVFLNEVYNKM